MCIGCEMGAWMVTAEDWPALAERTAEDFACEALPPAEPQPRVAAAEPARSTEPTSKASATRE